MRFLVILLSVVMSGLALAHPHVWVDSQYQVVVDKPSIDTLEANWSLDLFTSASLIEEYDVDGDGKFAGQEKADMIDVLKSFEKYGYFIHMKVDGKKIEPKQVTIVDIGVKDKELWMKLGITLPKPVDLDKSTLSLAFGDEEYYFAMVPLEAGLVQLSGMLAETCTPVTRDDTSDIGIESWVDLHCEP